MSARIVEDPHLRNATGVYRDRADAGVRLGRFVAQVHQWHSPVCCPVPAGGVPVAVEVARILAAPVRLAVVRKVHIPWNQEAGFGAVTWDGQVFINDELVRSLGLSTGQVAQAVEETRLSVQERLARFRPVRPEPALYAREVILVDDGLASGYTMRAAEAAIRRHAPRSVTIAVPTAHADSLQRVTPSADCIVCPNVRTGPFFAVADAYREWHDVTDSEVMADLQKAADEGLF
jgi:predicted phosphoribosyltransferase